MRVHALETRDGEVVVVNPSPPLERMSARLLVSPTVYRLCWWFIVGMHWFNGTLAFVFASIYMFFSLPVVYPTAAVLGVPLWLFRVSAWSYGFVALAHWVSLARVIQSSLRAKRLVFTMKHHLVDDKSVNPSSPSWFARALEVVAEWRRQFWGPWNRVFSIDGICGVNGEYFYVAFFAREFLEIALQTYQAHQLSSSVRRSWITSLAVTIIIINALSSTLVQVSMRRHSDSARRFVSLLIDMCIDFCCAALIPLCVVAPVIASYDPTVGSIATRLVFDDTWFISSLAEIRQFCITSNADLLATMVPQVSVLVCLNVAKKLVQNAAHVRQPREGEATDPQPHKRTLRHTAMAIVAMSRPIPSAATTSRSLHSFQVVGTLEAVTSPQPRCTRVNRVLSMAVHTFLCVWAVAILTIHLKASSYAASSAVSGCRLSLNAWFATKTPCSVMQINCHRDRIVGASAEIATAIESLDRSILKKLIITHCISLEMPQRLLEFNELTDLDLYNSTLVAWSSEAAATSTSLRSLTNFNWFSSPYTAFPEGLLHKNLPLTFTRFAIARSNLTQLPENLGQLWVGAFFDVFSIQFTKLAHLPSTFSKLQIQKLRLISNEITELDDDALANKQLRALHLSGNPLRQWPSSIGDTSKLVELYVEHTQLKNLSVAVTRWWDQRPRSGLRLYSLSLVGSPMCLQDDVYEVCGIDYDNANGTYRWDLIERQRPLDS